jgi:GST-like protein
MIDLYYWPTPNGHKIIMFLEETALPYRIIPVNIGARDQFAADFLKIAPNNKMPAIVDSEPADLGAPISVFESAAILIYLAEKVGQFLPADVRGRVQTLQWLAWQVAGLGPMAGQSNHFNRLASDKLPYAIDRFKKETSRLFRVLDDRLSEAQFLAGPYSIADMASYPWAVLHKHLEQDIGDFPSVARWLSEIADRPATIRAYAAGEHLKPASR